jgi:predicted phosphoribosyltransferase
VWRCAAPGAPGTASGSDLGPPFRDRADAGRQLAQRLAPWRGLGDPLVLALPRGGVPVGFEVARELGAPLDVFLVRKLGVPGHPELAMGALGSGDVLVLNERLIAALELRPEQLDAAVRRERAELARRERLYRGERPPPAVRGRSVVLVDDGLAPGSSMQAALVGLRREAPLELVVAVPVGAAETCAELARTADAVVCACTPAVFYAVGAFYLDFEQTSDDEVRELLARARADREAAPHDPHA